MGSENFIEESWGFKQTIKNEGKIYTATAPGKAPFVATQDIARVAFQALMMKEKPKLDYHCLGPEMLTYDDVSCSRLFLLAITTVMLTVSV